MFLEWRMELAILCSSFQSGEMMSHPTQIVDEGTPLRLGHGKGD